MNLLLALILLIGGLVLLGNCADVLVSGAVGLAERLGVRPLVIGLTVIAMGTSAPELAASITAVVRGSADVAVGDVYGSNIANLALVGGLVALIRPLRVRLATMRREIPLMLAAALLLWPVVSDLCLTLPEGVVLLVLFAGLMAVIVHGARRQARSEPQVVPGIRYEGLGSEDSFTGQSLKLAVFKVVLGLGGLVLGADMAIRGAVFVGGFLGLSKAVIGLTIVAVGTSLPELATCLVAASRGHHDISVGNLVGSNIFNTLLVVGTAGIFGPFELSGRLAGADYWIMVLVSLGFALAILAGRLVLKRVWAVFLLLGYAGYMVYLLAYTRGI